MDGEPDEASAAAAGEVATALASPGPIGRIPAHCVAKWGIDWSRVLGVVDAEIVSPFCTEIHTGVSFIPEVLWITNAAAGIPGGPVVYPDGYEPFLKAPMDDFRFKLESVRYVLQPSGKEVTFHASDIEKLLTVADLFRGSDDFTVPQLVWPTTALLGKLPPLPPGDYSTDIHFVMSDTHCDGQTTDFAASCLPPGDTLAITRDFIVVP
jgi:hypothetical protein